MSHYLGNVSIQNNARFLLMSFYRDKRCNIITDAHNVFVLFFYLSFSFSDLVELKLLQDLRHKTGFCCDDTNSGKLKVNSIMFGWLWSKMGAAF